jgi:hypothetical protein
MRSRENIESRFLAAFVASRDKARSPDPAERA